LIKQLRREAARNPAKAGVLGLLVVVALWFWAPLVWGWIGSREGTSQPSPILPPQVTSNASGAAPASTATAAAPATTWQQLVEWRKQDPRTTAADTLKTRRDPFHAIPAPVVEAEVKAAPKAAPVVLTPEQLGLKLSSTVVGSDRRVALINGRIFREGQVIKCGKEAQEILFRLAEIHSRHVVLERDGHRFELAIPDKKLSNRIELSGSPGR